jgi:hypothetical protein
MRIDAAAVCICNNANNLWCLPCVFSQRVQRSMSLDGRQEGSPGVGGRLSLEHRASQHSTLEQQQQQPPNLPQLRRRVRISEPAGPEALSSSNSIASKRSSKPLVSPRAQYVRATEFDSPTAAAAAVASSIHRVESCSSDEEGEGGQSSSGKSSGSSGGSGGGGVLEGWDRQRGPRERFGGRGAGRKGGGGMGSPRLLQRVRSGPAMYQLGDGSSTAQVIRMAGYPLELHEVVTPDGYLLRIERIPAKASHNVVFMMHGECRGGEGRGGFWVEHGCCWQHGRPQ